MNPLKWLADILKEKYRLSDHQIYWLFVPVILVMVFGALFGVFRAFELSIPWSEVFAGWITLVLFVWIPITNNLKVEQAFVISIVVALLMGSLSYALWVVFRGFSIVSLAWGCFLCGILTAAVRCVADRRPALLPRLAQSLGVMTFTLLVFSTPFVLDRYQHAIPSVGAERVGVGVAKFTLDPDRKVQAGIVEQLNYEIRKDSFLSGVVDLRELSQSVTGDTDSKLFENARAILRESGLGILVFGRVTDRGVFTRIVVANPLESVMQSDILLPGTEPSREVPVTLLVARMSGALINLMVGRCATSEYQFRAVGEQVAVLQDTRLKSAARLFEANSILCQSYETGQRLNQLRIAVSMYGDLAGDKNLGMPWAAFGGLGLAYRKLSEYEEPVANLTKAIAAYRDAEAALDLAPEYWSGATLMTNFGVAYEKLAGHERPLENLQRSIALHNEALSILAPYSHAEPILRARIYNNLGVARYRIALRDENIIERRQKLMAAIKTYSEGLPRVTRTDDLRARDLYGLMKSNLADAHTELALLEDRRENLRMAIVELDEGLAVISLAEAPDVFAEVQYKLGMAQVIRQQDDIGKWTVPLGWSHLACSLVVFDRLELRRAGIVARELRTVELETGKLGADKFVGFLRGAGHPRDCSYQAEDIPGLIEKWIVKGG